VSEQNTLEAFLAAARLGFGIELDIRDFFGQVVVAHDSATAPGLDLQESLSALKKYRFSGVLALNVKADGLSGLINKEALHLNAIPHFFFDMSVPETVRFDNLGLARAHRVSDLEPIWPASHWRILGEQLVVWLDSFSSDWWLDSAWENLIPEGSNTFIVSPELHGRDPSKVWERVRDLHQEGRRVGICTDHPVDFLAFMG